MKNFFYILSLIFIAAIVYSVMNMNFDVGLFSEDNINQWLVICAGVCGLILSLIYVRYQSYKNGIEDKNKNIK